MSDELKRALNLCETLNKENCQLLTEMAHLKSEVIWLRKLEEQMCKRHVMEPNHSRQDHECVECEVLADLKAMRRSWEKA
jgi:hypothetical protein